jgi:HEAT repeat protein
MTGSRAHRHVVRNRKKAHTPLSKLRPSDAVRTVVKHPRRLEELLLMLGDKDRRVRTRAAATVARLAESHPRRLLRVILRLRDTLSDDSASVRWYIIYAFGKLGLRFPTQCHRFLSDVVARLEDENRVVRAAVTKAISRIAAGTPEIVEQCFQSLKKDIPPAVSRILKRSASRAPKS